MVARKESTPRIISMAGRDLAGFHKNLHEGFDQLGIENHFFFERVHPFYNCHKKKGFLEKSIHKLGHIILKPGMSKLYKITALCLLYPIIILLKSILFVSYFKKYDVFIFGANYSFIGLYIERIILKMAGKIIIDPVSGSDVRPPYMSGNYIGATPRKIYWATYLKYKLVTTKLKFTTYLIDHPTVSQFHNKDYIPHLYVGFPFFLPEQPTPESLTKPLILHAPSHPQKKGTDIVRAAIADLKKDYTFDYEELIGVPHTKVMEKIQQCTFVINELYSDTPMAGLDTEAAWFGKPSIVGGYNLNMVIDTINGYDIPPTYRIYPTKDNLKKAVIHLLTDPEYCQTLGQDAKNFVKTHWNAKMVAQKYLDIIQNKIPSHIMRSAKDDIYFQGSGIQYDVRKNNVRNLVHHYGLKSLRLSHKPMLRQAIADDIQSD